MIKLVNLLKEAGEGGQTSGKLELVKTPVDKARKYVLDKNFDLKKEIPDFDKNYLYAQKMAAKGWTQRKDMPVITDNDVKYLQYRLPKGYIDINAPHAPDWDRTNPFPQGLAGGQAEKWLKAGLPQYDKTNLKDDMVKVTKSKVPVGRLKPIQKQIYFDKSIAGIIQFGVKGSKNFLFGKSFYIISSDNYIIDGHHRYLSSILLDPKGSVNALVIDLPISKLLPLTLAYGDAIGNKRNA